MRPRNKRSRDYIAEIENALSAFPTRTSSQNPESYIGGGQSQLRYIGLRVPHLRQALRAGFSFSNAEPDVIAEVWDQIWWDSDCYEVMSLALAWFYDPKQRLILRPNWPRLRAWSERIDNWAHSDTLSGIYARIHEDCGREVYKTFREWNRSENPWLRRLSIVSLFYYSSQRQKYPSFKQVATLLKPQLNFDHYYVQKGVGWTLRESGNVYPRETFAFIEGHISKISSHAFSAATEKMTPRQRHHLKNLRRMRRGKPS
ncbi:MAG: DNA alkylation repair protein [Bdellovibrionales bacterium]